MATKKAPRVPRQCLCCGAEFLGTPKATRCGPCKVAGRKVPTKTQAARAKRRKCRSCQITKPVEEFEGHEYWCSPCQEEHKLASLDPETEAREIAEAKRLRLKKRLHDQVKRLDERTKAPRGYPRMSSRTARTPIGLLWLQLCAADGAAGSVMYTSNTDLTEEDKLMLMTSFYRLRAKNYRPDQIAKLDPKALMKAEAQEAIADLPQVEEEATQVTDEFDPIEGDENLREELNQIADQQARHEARIALGLATAE